MLFLGDVQDGRDGADEIKVAVAQAGPELSRRPLPPPASSSGVESGLMCVVAVSLASPAGECSTFHCRKLLPELPDSTHLLK
jgi:hypothetical protein